MSEPIVLLTIVILSVFVGVEVISKVSSTLHTPLMSGANAIHGIILLGAVIVTGRTESAFALVIGLLAIVLAAINMVGGFVVTDRMLQMFVRRRPGAGATSEEPARPALLDRLRASLPARPDKSERPDRSSKPRSGKHLGNGAGNSTGNRPGNDSGTGGTAP